MDATIGAFSADVGKEVVSVDEQTTRNASSIRSKTMKNTRTLVLVFFIVFRLGMGNRRVF